MSAQELGTWLAIFGFVGWLVAILGLGSCAAIAAARHTRWAWAVTAWAVTLAAVGLWVMWWVPVATQHGG